MRVCVWMGGVKYSHHYQVKDVRPSVFWLGWFAELWCLLWCLECCSEVIGCCSISSCDCLVIGWVAVICVRLYSADCVSECCFDSFEGCDSILMLFELAWYGLGGKDAAVCNALHGGSILVESVLDSDLLCQTYVLVCVC